MRQILRSISPPKVQNYLMTDKPHVPRTIDQNGQSDVAEKNQAGPLE
jgi:hypothetical protein